VVINDRWGSDTRHKHGGYWTTEYTAGMSGIDHPWEENRAWVIAMATTAPSVWKITVLPTNWSSCGGHREPRRQPAARYWAAADGTIPVIMQDRLHQIGVWLKVNGEASTAPGPGRRPAVEHGRSPNRPVQL